MKLPSMSKDDLSIVEQHIGTAAWLIVIALLTWNVNTTNNLQITAAESSVELRGIKNKLESRAIADKDIDSRLDTLERKVDRIQSRFEFNKK